MNVLSALAIAGTLWISPANAGVIEDCETWLTSLGGELKDGYQMQERDTDHITKMCVVHFMQKDGDDWGFVKNVDGDNITVDIGPVGTTALIYIDKSQVTGVVEFVKVEQL